MVASPTTCRATPQMGGGMEEAAVGGLGNLHEEEGSEEGSEDEEEAVDLEKVRVDTTISRHKCLYSHPVVFLPEVAFRIIMQDHPSGRDV